MSSKRLTVTGGGPGGYTAAFAASGLRASGLAEITHAHPAPAGGIFETAMGLPEQNANYAGEYRKNL